jgi:hypothetical protein
MVIATEPSLPSAPPSAADWVAISIAAALESSITAAAVVASAAVTIAITNNNDHPCNGHDVDNCRHDGYEDVIVDDGPPSLLFLSNYNKGNAFLTRHTPPKLTPLPPPLPLPSPPPLTMRTMTATMSRSTFPPSQQPLPAATQLRRQEPHQSKLPCHLSFLVPQRYLCMRILKDLIGR